MYDVAVKPAPVELVLGALVAPAVVRPVAPALGAPVAPGVVRPVAPVEDGPVGLDGKLLVPPLLTDALFSMNDAVPVELAPVRAVGDVPRVAFEDDVVAPLVPVTPPCSLELRQPVSVIVS